DKGVLSDSLLERRLVGEASSDPKKGEIIEQLRSDKQRLTELQLETNTKNDLPKKPSAQVGIKGNTEREKLSTEIERLEGALARQVAGLGKARRALSVTLEQVQSALPHKTTLIELLRYSHYLGRDKFEP